LVRFWFHRLGPQVAHFSSSVDTFAAPTAADRKGKHKKIKKNKNKTGLTQCNESASEKG